MIYVVQLSTLPFVKIGYSKSTVDARVATIQGAVPLELRLLYKGDGTFQEEQEFHRKFKPFKTRGEWYLLTPTASAMLEALFGVKLDHVDLAGPIAEAIVAQKCAQLQKRLDEANFVSMTLHAECKRIEAFLRLVRSPSEVALVMQAAGQGHHEVVMDFIKENNRPADTENP